MVRHSVNIKTPLWTSASDLVRPLREYVRKAYAAWRIDARQDLFICLELLIAQLVDLRTRVLNLPNGLQNDIQYKLAINRGRGPCNGGRDPRS